MTLTTKTNSGRTARRLGQTERFLEFKPFTTKSLILKYARREAKREIHFDLQLVTHEYLKWSRLPAGEKNAYNEDYLNDLLDMMKIENMHEDGDIFEDHSWENVFSNGEKVYREWCLEFYLTMFLNRKVNRDEIMKEKCICFRLCRKEHVYTLPEFTVLLGLYSESDVQHRLFETHFLRLMTNDEGFNHEAYWSRIGQPRTEKKKLADIRYPLFHIMHQILVIAFVHRSGSRDKVQKPDLWLLSLLDEGYNENVAWILAEYLSKRASGIKETSEICGGHFVTKIARKLGFYNQRELAKCSEPIKSESWDDRMFGKALDRRAKKLSPITPLEGPPQASDVPRGEPSGLNSSWGDWNVSLNDIEHRDIWRDSMLMRNGYMLEHSMPILHYLANEANFAYPPYEPPNVPPYPVCLRKARHASKRSFLQDLAHLSDLYFQDDSAINLVDRVHQTIYSKLLLKFFLLPLVDNPSYSVVLCIVRIRPEQGTLSHLLSLFLVRDYGVGLG
ncbi:hypothetical protein Tco_0458269 [Tanacetum coccineum]